MQYMSAFARLDSHPPRLANRPRGFGRRHGVRGCEHSARFPTLRFSVRVVRGSISTLKRWAAGHCWMRWTSATETKSWDHRLRGVRRANRVQESNWKSLGGIRVHSLRGWSFEAAALVARVNRAWSGGSRRGPMGPPGLQRNHLVSKPGFAQKYSTWKTATRG